MAMDLSCVRRLIERTQGDQGEAAAPALPVRPECLGIRQPPAAPGPHSFCDVNEIETVKCINVSSRLRSDRPLDEGSFS